MFYTQETTPQISTVQVTAKQSICIACAEGDHDRIRLNEHCDCPCHGVLNTVSEVAS